MATVLSAKTLVGDAVKNLDGEELGKVEEIMIDVKSGRVAYVVVTFGSKFMHSGKLFAIPWESVAVDQGDHKLILNVPREKLESAEGFDKDHWPDLADDEFATRTYAHYGVVGVWQRGAEVPSIPAVGV